MCKRQTNLFELLQSDETEFWEKLSQIDVKQFTQNITTQKTKQDIAKNKDYDNKFAQKREQIQ